MSVNILLLVIPIFTAVSGMFVYRFQGKKQFLQLDIVQFLYTFFVAPTVFVWFKVLLFSLLRTDQAYVLSESQLFIFDTLFSTLYLFIFAFIVMHSLTKTFYLKKHFDPFYDLFHHSEYIHLWLSHQAIILGGMVLLMIFSLANIFFPLPVVLNRGQMYGLLGIGFLTGLATFIGLIMADPQQNDGRFIRSLKFYIAVFFTFQVLLYIIFEPSLSSTLLIYWLFSAISSTLAFCVGTIHRSKKALTVFERIRNLFIHKKWGWNIELKK